MKFALRYCNTGRYADPADAVELLQAAEEAGFESAWTVEHTVVPEGYESAYPYSPDGKMAGGRTDIPLPDPLIWLSFAAAATSTIKLGTAILILPQHNPVIVAKQVATLDHLSGGRALLGVGVGWLREEFEALGVPFEDRGARMDEYIAVMRELWTAERPSFDGAFVRFDGAQCRPRPVNGTVPIIVGGHSKAAARRAGPARRRVLPGARRPGGALRPRAADRRGSRPRPRRARAVGEPARGSAGVAQVGRGGRRAHPCPGHVDGRNADGDREPRGSTRMEGSYRRHGRPLSRRAFARPRSGPRGRRRAGGP